VPKISLYTRAPTFMSRNKRITNDWHCCAFVLNEDLLGGDVNRTIRLRRPSAGGNLSKVLITPVTAIEDIRIYIIFASAAYRQVLLNIAVIESFLVWICQRCADLAHCRHPSIDTSALAHKVICFVLRWATLGIVSRRELIQPVTKYSEYF